MTAPVRSETGSPRSDSARPVSARRPYTKPVSRTWFLSTRAYRAYALREFSAVVVGLFVFNLVVGLVSLHRGVDSWQWWVDLQTRPLNLVLTVLALLFAVVHATTWFQATPKIIRVRRGRKHIHHGWIILQHYVLLALFAVAVVFWLLGGF